MAKAKKIKEEAENTPKGYEDTFEMDPNVLEELSSQIRRDLIEAETDKYEWINERVKDEKAYFGIKKDTDWPFKGAAKVSSQMHRIMVDTTAANLVSSANAPENILSAHTNKSQSIENAKYVEDIHNRLARTEYMMPEVLDRSWHKALIESFCVLKPVYQFDVLESVQTVTRWLPSGYDAKDIKYDSDTDTVYATDGTVIPSLDADRLPTDENELAQMDLHECTLEITKERSEEGIRILSISGDHIFLPVSSPGETPYEKYQRAPYVIEDEYKTVQEMQMLQEAGKIKNFELFGDLLTDNIFSAELRDVKETQAGHLDITKHARHLVRNVWWNGKFEYKGKLRELQVYMNYETGTVLKVKINNFGIRPYFPQVPFPVDGTPYGESLPKKLRPLITELELAMNTVINMGLIKAYPPKFFDPTGGFDPKTLGAIGPNAYVPVRDPSKNVFMPPQPEDPRILMEMIKLLMDLIERTAANSDAVQGQVSPTANTTAFEVQQSLVRAGVRFDLIYRRLKAQLDPMFHYIQMLVLRFMPIEKEIQLMGEQAVIKDEQGGETSRLQTIHQQEGRYGMSLTGNSMTEEQMQAQKAEKLFMMMNQDPYLTYKPESPYYLRFNVIKSLAPNIQDKLLAKPEEVAKLLRDRQQVQNEQEQQAVEDGKKHSDPSAQMQAQMMQMELQLKAQQAQLDAQAKQQQMQLDLEKQQADMHMKQKEHDQKMRQNEETHAQKLEMMKSESAARQKESKKNASSDK